MKRLALALATSLGLAVAAQAAVAPAANAGGSAGPTIIAHLGGTTLPGSSWRSTPSHTPNSTYRACVAIYGYDEDPENGDGWNISLRYSSSHIAFFVGPSYHHNVSSYCTPWQKQSKSSVYTRVTARAHTYISEADVWQYWN